ncbi:MAG: hypothetical protein QNJ78_05560 [Gammaproteobacteria bacterium]|nr:hypothetical protein [Gammaproteobacteria bacterium]
MAEEHIDFAARDAVIYIPGLAVNTLSQDIETIGNKIAGSLERNSEEIGDAFVLKDGVEEAYADGNRTRMRQVQVTTGEEVRTVADLYELDYRSCIRQSFEERSLLGKCLVVLVMLFGSTPAFLRAAVQPGKTVAEKAQLFFAGTILGLMALYFFVLLITALGTLTLGVGESRMSHGMPGVDRVEQGQLLRPAPQTLDTSTNEPPSAGESANAQPVVDVWDRGWHALVAVFPLLQGLIVIIAALGAFRKESLKAVISEAATEFVTAVGYIQAAERKQSVNGQLNALLEYVLEKQPAYRKVHVLGYSFGSLIALDSLFPRYRPALHLNRVDSLVTIGCPFDMVRIFWPDYFTRRQAPSQGGLEWMNIYSRYDVLGSNFRDDDQEQDAESLFEVVVEDRATEAPVSARIKLSPRNFAYDLGMQMGKYPLATVLTFKGFRAHQLYWEGGGVSELSCFDLVMPRLLLHYTAGHPHGDSRP